MPTIAHPDDDRSIDVEVIDSESHRGEEMVQVEATDDDVNLTDQSGESPWLFEEELQ